MTTFSGTDLSEEISGTGAGETIIARGGNDTVSGAAGADIIIGDFASNILLDTDGATSFAGYADRSGWTVESRDGGHSEMFQTVETLPGEAYTLTYEIAANLAAGAGQGAVEVFWNSTSLGRFDAQSGLFEPITVSFTGTDGPGTLAFRSVEPEGGAAIDTSGPIYSYDKVIEIGGAEVTVAAFAEGQSNLYQVLNGTLVVFEPETGTYTQAGANATVTVNAIGSNMEDDLIYGIAVRDGVDALGNAVAQRDLVMLDADGLSYRIGETPYRSRTGDFDDKGNLWAFEADMDYFMRVDVSERDANGNPVVEKFKLPQELITHRVWDVAFDATTQTFEGVVRPNSEGSEGTLITIDVSGAEPKFELLPVVSTVIEGVTLEGLPAVTFGAATRDAERTLYIGGNSGDHDMDDSTGSSGGFYRVERDPDAGTAQLVLMAQAPRAASKDGAADPRALDPFAPIDVGASILIRDIAMVETPEADASFDDLIESNGGQDTLFGNQGEDQLVGSSAGDALSGGDADDALYGGAGPGHALSAIISVDDEAGNRYDQFGNLLEEDDDLLDGGAGNDLLNGSAGHDSLIGGDGDDHLSGGSGAYVLSGGAGNDTLEGGAQADRLEGDAGTDWLAGGSGADTLDGGEGADTLKGGSGDDALAGGDGADFLRGDIGNDVLEGGEGSDMINGGSDDDVLSGGSGKDYLNGASGDDVLHGGDGNDRIYLGAGEDVAAGGSGSDRFVFRSEDLDGSTDRITDFRNAGGEHDQIDLRALDLLGGAMAEDWLLAHVTLGDDGAVTAEIGNCDLLFESRGADQGAAFYDEICSGFLF